jgi:hypothetical protein
MPAMVCKSLIPVLLQRNNSNSNTQRRHPEPSSTWTPRVLPRFARLSPRRLFARQVSVLAEKTTLIAVTNVRNADVSVRGRIYFAEDPENAYLQDLIDGVQATAVTWDIQGLTPHGLVRLELLYVPCVLQTLTEFQESSRMSLKISAR